MGRPEESSRNQGVLTPALVPIPQGCCSGAPCFPGWRVGRNSAWPTGLEEERPSFPSLHILPALVLFAPVELSAFQGLSEEKHHVGERLGNASRAQ